MIVIKWRWLWCWGEWDVVSLTDRNIGNLSHTTNQGDDDDDDDDGDGDCDGNLLRLLFGRGFIFLILIFVALHWPVDWLSQMIVELLH